MKISKAEKEKVHRRILTAGVRVISRKGFRDATMRDIAQEAKIGDATIYKYFPTKEDLLHGYFRTATEELIERLQKIPGFEQYSLQEQLHALLETNLELFEEEREFVQIAYENVFLGNWLSAAAGSEQSKNRFFEILEDILGAAILAGEIPEPPFKKFLYELFWDYMIGITYYWLKDKSEKHESTTQLIDKSLDMIVAALKAGILAKATELAHFLMREHLLSRIRTFKAGERNLPFEKVKRKFMAGERHDGQN